jgi:hypothetical protein
MAGDFTVTVRIAASLEAAGWVSFAIDCSFAVFSVAGANLGNIRDSGTLFGSVGIPRASSVCAEVG